MRKPKNEKLLVNLVHNDTIQTKLLTRVNETRVKVEKVKIQLQSKTTFTKLSHPSKAVEWIAGFERWAGTYPASVPTNQSEPKECSPQRRPSEGRPFSAEPLRWEALISSS